MAAPYIPSQDGALATWAANFAGLITATPSDFGLDAITAAVIQAANDLYQASYALAGLTAPPHPHPVSPSTRTPVTVAQKNSDKLAFIVVARTYASQIRLNPGVTNMNKTALRLNLPNNSPVPIPQPATVPVLTIMSATPLRHTLKFRDEMASPTSRAKAPLSIGLELHRTIADLASVDPNASPYLGTFVKVPFFSEFVSDDIGKIATYFGRWITRAGSAGNNQALVGPWSNATSMAIV
jgi:hypothetical protein